MILALNHYRLMSVGFAHAFQGTEDGVDASLPLTASQCAKMVII